MRIDASSEREISVALPESVHEKAATYLLRPFNEGRWQEHLCFALWRPSDGRARSTALVHELVLPEDGDVLLRGNASFTSRYLERAADLAAASGSGLALMHNHLGPGWQDMSKDDIVAEQRTAPYALSTTSFPLVGMTLATDESWSGRRWVREAPRQYFRQWCRAVRVVGTRLDMTFHPELAPVSPIRPELERTISAWGESCQAQLARLHVGVVGLGSVGRIIAESIGRIGIERPTFIDFDRLDFVNLDRQIGATRADAAARRLKVEIARDAFRAGSPATDPPVNAVRAAVTEPAGLEAAFDCDVIFSCVDRPWARRVLNHLAYAHLIPVIDGGIIIRTKDGGFRGAEWSCRTAAPGRRCLACAEAYDPCKVDEERRGILDDPSYFDGLPEDIRRQASQNVLPFSLSLAAHECLQLVALVGQLLDQPDLGEQRFFYNLSEIEARIKKCKPGCEFESLVATGDSVYPRESMTGIHPAAERIRKQFNE